MMEARAQWHGFVVRDKGVFYGGASPPKPPERGTPRRDFLALATANCASFLTTDERYGFVKIPREARVWGILSF